MRIFNVWCVVVVVAIIYYWMMLVVQEIYCIHAACCWFLKAIFNALAWTSKLCADRILWRLTENKRRKRRAENHTTTCHSFSSKQMFFFFECIFESFWLCFVVAVVLVWQRSCFRFGEISAILRRLGILRKRYISFIGHCRIAINKFYNAAWRAERLT